MQGNKRKIPFISFYSLFGIGTFQGVTAEKVKKYWTPSTRASGCPQSSQAARSLLHLLSLAQPALRRAQGFRSAESIRVIFVLAKNLLVTATRAPKDVLSQWLK
jgi:hypothetical protein